MNQAWLKTLGYTADEVSTMNIFNVVHPDCRIECRNYIQRIIGGEKFGLIEIPFLTKDNRVIIVEGRITVHIDDGKPIATRGIFRDITEKKDAENKMHRLNDKLEDMVAACSMELYASEKRYREIDACMPGAVFEFCIDAAGKRSFPFMGHGIANLIGFTSSDCMKNAELFFQQIPADVLPLIEASLQASCDQLSPWLQEFPVHTPSGDKWLRGHSIPHRKTNGNTHWHGVFVEITDSKKAEAALHQAGNALRALNERSDYLFSSAPAIIYTCESKPPYKVTFISANVTKILGYAVAAFLDDTHFWADRTHPEDRDYVLGKFSDLPAQLSPSVQSSARGRRTHEYRFQHQDGSWRWMRDELSIICDPADNTCELVGYLIDVSEQRQKNIVLEDAHNLLKTVIDTVPVRIFWKDKDLRYLGCNAVFARNSGAASPEELIGKDDGQLRWRDHAETYRHDDRSVIASGIPKLGYEESQTTPDEQLVWTRKSKVPLRNKHEEIIGVLGISEDITEQKKAYDSMLLASTIYESSSEAIMITDENNRIIQINPAFTRMTGYEAKDIVDKNPSIFRSEYQDEVFYRNMWSELMQKDHWQGEVWDRKKDGSIHAKWVTMNIIRNLDGRVNFHVAQFSDITEKKQKDALIIRQANYDQLTQLPNRNLFKERLQQDMKQVLRNKQSLALMFLDLDHFKDINDTFGHDRGDELLKAVGRRILDCVREVDTVARLGGDEFAVILSNVDDGKLAGNIAQDILQSLNNPFILEASPVEYHVSISIGIALYPRDGTTLDNLMKHADQALYAAKEERNRFSFFTPTLQKIAIEKMVLMHDLRQAVKNNELLTYYQPIIDLSHGKVVKAEALLRWKHPRLGMVNPASFVPLAEQSGLIIEISEQVCDQSIQLIKQWYEKTGQILQVSINMSPVQFKQKNNFPFIDFLYRSDLPGYCLNVEITEGLLLTDSPVVKERLLEFRNHGIEISIDDFGTGFSSLSYLKKFDIDYLKIDQSFIKQLTESDIDRALVEAIVVMARKLNIRTIAEGVEARKQEQLLMNFGCDYVQGFLYSKPVTAAEFLQYSHHQMPDANQD